MMDFAVTGCVVVFSARSKGRVDLSEVVYDWSWGWSCSVVRVTLDPSEVN